MEQGLVIDLASRALLMVLLISGPILGLSLIVGLAVSIFQATTHIQEQTLTFIPKIVAILGACVLFGPWMLSTLVEYTKDLFLSINTFIR